MKLDFIAKLSVIASHNLRYNISGQLHIYYTTKQLKFSLYIATITKLTFKIPHGENT